MNYFSKTEKVLKHCLKERLSITTATVVGFLIMGTSMFAAAITQDMVDKSTGIEVSGGKNTVIKVSGKENTVDETLENKKSDSKEKTGWLVTVTDGDLNIGKAVVLKGTNLKNTTLNLYGNTNVVNNGTIEKAVEGWGAVTLTGVDGAEARLTNNGTINGAVDMEGTATLNNTKDINGPVYSDNNKGNKLITINNSGNINTKSEENTQKIKLQAGKEESATTAGVYIKAGDGNLKLNNTGSIGNLDLDYGVGTQKIAEAEILNEGTITGNTAIITSAEKVNINNKKDIKAGKFGIYLSKAKTLDYNIENSGTISVEQKVPNSSQVIGINLEGTGEALNTTSGKIVVHGQGYDKKPGLNIAGVVVDGGKFTNDGLVELADGTTYGIGIKVGTNGEAVNNGTIALGIGSNGNDKATATNNIAIKNDEGVAVNNGKIQVTDKTQAELKDFDITKLFVGGVINKGMLVDKDGNIVSQANDTELSGNLSSDIISEADKVGGAIVIKDGATITAEKDKVISADALNVAGGTLTIQKDEKNKNTTVNFKDTNINLAKSGETAGKVVVGEGSNFVLNGGIVNGVDKNTGNDIELSKDSTLTLNGATINANVGEASGNTGKVDVTGNTNFNGNLNVKTITIGSSLKSKSEEAQGVKSDKLHLSSTSKIGGENGGSTVTIQDNGQLVLEVGAKGETALGNSQKITVKKGEVTATNVLKEANKENADILLEVGNLTGESVDVQLGKETNLGTATIGVDGGSEVYKVNGKLDNGVVKVEYNKNLFTDARLNGINNAAMGVSNLFSTEKSERSNQMEKILEGSIYSETAKAAYNGVKLTEETLRGMDRIAETGKWAAIGNGIYNKHSYDRSGYDSDIETSGLLGVMEYGTDDNTAVGVTIGGAYQDISSATGNADGTLLYLGTYTKKTFGAYSLTAGFGYQFGNYDANNTTGKSSASDRYDSNTVSTYVEGRYKMDLGDNVSFQPKVKVGYTYMEQDKAQDANIGVTDAELSTFDAEVGADLVKTYALKDGKANLIFGASYIRAYGDIDKEFKGQFSNSTEKFNIKGAELSENTGKFTLSLEVSKDMGLFYNGGVNLNVGSDNTRDYGVTVGVGYKF